MAMAMAPVDEKLALWTRWQPVQAGLLLLVAAACGLALARGTGPARWVAAAILPPLLVWPGWAAWLLLVNS